MEDETDNEWIDITKWVYSQYLRGMPIDDICEWMGYVFPNDSLKNPNTEDINNLIDQMNELFL